jgi:Ca2+-binding RTX toxin-like protein
VRLFALAAAVLLLMPGAAQGATASVESDPSTFSFFSYLADAGEANQVVATFASDVVTIRDTGATITAGAGCVSVDAHEVNCATTGFVELFAFLDDLDDTLAIQSGSNWNVQGGDGNDTLSSCPTPSCGGTKVEGNAGDDTLESNGCAFCSFIGNTGDDTFIGGASTDDFRGGPGNDTLNGLAGNDFLAPGAGDDIVDGGAGVDDVVNFIGAGVGISADLASGTATGQGTDTLIGIESIFGSDRADHLSGDANSNGLSGLGGADVLRGREGNDELVGGFGPRDDVLYGGSGNDLLRGGGGEDIVRGGPGSDRLLGEGGNDRLGAQDGFLDHVRGGAGFDRAYVDRRLDDFTGIERLFF